MATDPRGHVVLLGPTGSGKSDVAMAWARRHPGAEIVAVDAMQVYRGMDIGTAKPTAADRAEVPHHCLDLVDPWSEFTVADYVAEFRRVESDASHRGAPLVVVAGTGLYLRAALDGLNLPGQWPAVRSSLDRQLQLEGSESLYRRLQLLDPAAAARIEPGNDRRIVRALEVTVGSGRPFSSFGPGLDVYPAATHRLIGLRWPRALLAERVARRVRTMIAAGWLDEVARLRAGPPWSRTAAMALGYRQLADHLDGRVTLDEAIDDIVARTRSYAVRQERWFRRDPRITWVDIEHDPVTTALAALDAT
jgi:tRNA dimethylallyltransferase